MINERLRQKKISRHKARRKQNLKRIETVQERKIRVLSFLITGSRHAARKFRKKWWEEFNKKQKVKDKKFLNKIGIHA